MRSAEAQNQRIKFDRKVIEEELSVETQAEYTDQISDPTLKVKKKSHNVAVCENQEFCGFLILTRQIIIAKIIYI